MWISRARPTHVVSAKPLFFITALSMSVVSIVAPHHALASDPYDAEEDTSLDALNRDTVDFLASKPSASTLVEETEVQVVNGYHRWLLGNVDTYEDSRPVVDRTTLYAPVSDDEEFTVSFLAESHAEGAHGDRNSDDGV